MKIFEDKSFKIIPLSVIESDLVEWFHIIPAKNIFICEPLIKEKTLEFSEKHGVKDFSVFNEWIDHLKK